jgi:hypothetical protein
VLTIVDIYRLNREGKQYPSYSPTFALLLSGDIIHFSIRKIQGCTLSKKPTGTVAAWSCIVAYDTIAIVLAIINTLDRPRRRDMDIMRFLKGDGAPFFLVISPRPILCKRLFIHRQSSVCFVTSLVKLKLNSLAIALRYTSLALIVRLPVSYFRYLSSNSVLHVVIYDFCS